MAAFVILANSLLLLLINVAAAVDGNSTSFNHDVDPKATETYTIHTTSTNEVVSLSSEPLVLSGRLDSLIREVSSLCPCNEQRNVCDVNCCCDSECSREEVSLFTSCSLYSISGYRQLCHQDVMEYSLGSTIEGFSTLDLSLRKDVNYDIFCIHSQNHVESMSYTLPAIPTDRHFDSVFKELLDFPLNSKTNGALLSASTGYQYGDDMEASRANGERSVLQLPAAAVNMYCLDTNPVAFLKQQHNRCTRSLVVERDCTHLQALNIHTYTDTQLLSGKNTNATIVPMVVMAVLKSLEGTLLYLELGAAEKLVPALLNPALCLNVVHQVDYVMKYNPAGEIVNLATNVVLGPIQGNVLSLEQEFTVTFVQEESSEQRTFERSGNPGYATGLPVVSGTPSAGIVQSTDPIGTLTIIKSSQNQDCLHGHHKRSPVLFGQDMVSGCTLRLEEPFNCSLVSQVLLDVLRGSSNIQYVAAFGTPTLDDSLDWVPIDTIFEPGSVQGAQSCIIPLSRHLEIEWTKYGQLVNPQARIVSIKEVIHPNTSSMALLSRGGSVVTVTSSVKFVAVSAPALPGFRAQPTIDAKLPFEFFFPFT